MSTTNDESVQSNASVLRESTNLPVRPPRRKNRIAPPPPSGVEPAVFSNSTNDSDSFTCVNVEDAINENDSVFTNDANMDYFRGDKPLPAIPKDAGSRFAAGLSSLASRAPPLPSKPQSTSTNRGRSKSPMAQASNLVSNARNMFEKSGAAAAVKYVPKDKLVNAAKSVPTSTYVNAVQQSHPSMSGGSGMLASAIDRAKTVDTKHYVSAIDSYGSHQNSSSSGTVSSVSALKSQLENKLNFQPNRPAPPSSHSQPAHTPSYSSNQSTYTSSTSGQSAYTSSSSNQSAYTSATPNQSAFSYTGASQSVDTNQPHATASYAFSAAESDELSFAAGDTLYLLRTIDDKWVHARHATTNTIGLAPLEYLHIMRPINDEPIRATPPRSAAAPSTAIIAGPRVKALFDYNSGVDGDLAFSVDDVLKLVEKVDADWWRGEASDGRTGLLPANYVEIIEDIRAPQAHAPQKPAAKTVLRTATALYDYDTGHLSDLSFRAGDSVEILSLTSDEWAIGRLESQRAIEGSFPLNYVTDSSSLVGQTLTCIAEFKGENTGDLWMEVGDKVRITEVVDDNWFRGQLQLDFTSSRNIPSGLLPRTYVQ